MLIRKRPRPEYPVEEMYSRKLITEKYQHKNKFGGYDFNLEVEKLRKTIKNHKPFFNPYLMRKRKLNINKGAGLSLDYENMDQMERLRHIVTADVRQINSSGRYREVYIRTLLCEKTNKALAEKVLRFRENRILSSGYVYAPYIPIETAPIVIGENDFQPTESMRGRYSATTINNRFYGTIRVGGL